MNKFKINQIDFIQQVRDYENKSEFHKLYFLLKDYIGSINNFEENTKMLLLVEYGWFLTRFGLQFEKNETFDNYLLIAEKYISQGMELLKISDKIEYYLLSIKYLTLNYFQQNKLEKAVKLNNLLIQKAHSAHNYKMLAEAYSDNFFINMTYNKYSTSKEIVEDAIAIENDYEDPQLKILNYMHLGLILSKIGNYKKSIAILKNTIKNEDAVFNKLTQRDIYGFLSNSFFYLKKYRKSQFYLAKAKTLSFKLKNDLHICLTINLELEQLIELRKIEHANTLLNEYLYFTEKVDLITEKINYLFFYSQINFYKKNYDKSCTAYHEIMKLLEQQPPLKSSMFLNMKKIYFWGYKLFSKNNYKQSAIYLKIAYTHIIEIMNNMEKEDLKNFKKKKIVKNILKRSDKEKFTFISI